MLSMHRIAINRVSRSIQNSIRIYQCVALLIGIAINRVSHSIQNSIRFYQCVALLSIGSHSIQNSIQFYQCVALLSEGQRILNVFGGLYIFPARRAAKIFYDTFLAIEIFAARRAAIF